MVGVALPSIGADLSMTQSQLQWIVSGYVLGHGGFLLLGGRASDLFGRRRVFVWALAVFATASVVSAVVRVDEAIVALRFVKGIAAAFTVPAGLSIMTTTFAEGPARNKAPSAARVASPWASSSADCSPRSRYRPPCCSPVPSRRRSCSPGSASSRGRGAHRSVSPSSTSPGR